MADEVYVKEGRTVLEELDKSPVACPFYLECECVEESRESSLEEGFIVLAVEHAMW